MFKYDVKNIITIIAIISIITVFITTTSFEVLLIAFSAWKLQ